MLEEVWKELGILVIGIYSKKNDSKFYDFDLLRKNLLRMEIFKVCLKYELFSDSNQH